METNYIISLNDEEVDSYELFLISSELKSDEVKEILETIVSEVKTEFEGEYTTEDLIDKINENNHFILIKSETINLEF